MTKPLILARQSAHPRGLLGHIVARVMVRKTARVNREALEILDVEPADAVLEVGCGHGHTLRRIAERHKEVTLTGVDPSDVMLRIARRRCRKLIMAGRVVLTPGVAARLPFEDASFGKALTVHTTYFWPDLHAGLVEVRRVLRPGGRFVVAFRPGDDPVAVADVPASVYRLDSCDEVRRALGEAGFSRVDLQTLRIGPTTLALASAESPTPVARSVSPR